MGEVDEEELALDHWLDSEGQPQKLGKMNLLEEEILSEKAFEDLPLNKQVHEATAMKGATVEYWYRQAGGRHLAAGPLLSHSCRAGPGVGHTGAGEN